MSDDPIQRGEDERRRVAEAIYEAAKPVPGEGRPLGMEPSVVINRYLAMADAALAEARTTSVGLKTDGPEAAKCCDHPWAFPVPEGETL